MHDIVFPVGYHRLHSDVSLNFQLNRFWNWVGEEKMLDELGELAPRIHSYNDWVRELLEVSESAYGQGRSLAGAYHARAGEFFMLANDPRRARTRRRFVDTVLQAHGVLPSQHHRVPYEGRSLPAYRFAPSAPRGTIVVFGGFDSYIEEWLPFLLALEQEGLDIVAFDGPGQGGALEDGIPMTVAWGKPVRAVLDHFRLSDVTLLGFSLGG
ncbi:MAG TPA: hypothetical protein VN894_06670, partial [Polyangiaceae bacterium]|nr:hypothetical protein [Polyangiaceae bacterium]